MESGEVRRVDFEFTGKGAEYFKIWIVNLLLTIITLGIYSAWAKVRRLQYFYRNTRLDGASFDYHGEPIAILKGRLIAVCLFAAYQWALTFQPILGGVLGVVIALVMPWFILRSLKFRLYNTSYRGLRFGFVGTERESYRVFLVNVILAAMTLYLLAPFTHQRIKQFQHTNSRFGNAAFEFSAKVGAFYRIYLMTLGLSLIALIGFTVLAGLGMQMIFVLLPFVLIAIGAYFTARVQNLIWNHTLLEGQPFRSSLSEKSFVWLSLSNLFAVLMTLGLYLPFAQIRLASYRLHCLSLELRDDLDHFVTRQEAAVAATGEETAEIFDVDIAL